MRVPLALTLASVAASLAVAAPAGARPAAPTAPLRVAPAAAEPWRGVFRIQFALRGHDSAPAALVVEHASDGISAFVLADEKGLPLGSLRIDGDTLRARLTTDGGTGDLTLRVTGDEVRGTFRVGKRRWDVTGVRTA